MAITARVMIKFFKSNLFLYFYFQPQKADTHGNSRRVNCGLLQQPQRKRKKKLATGASFIH